MSQSQSYDEEKFKTKLVGYASSDGGGSSDASDSDASVTDHQTKRQKKNQATSNNESMLQFKLQNVISDKDSAYKTRAPNFAKDEFSHPIFEQDRNLFKGDSTAHKRGGNRRERPKEVEQELLVFGYTSKLFDLKESVESGFIDLESGGISTDDDGVSSVWLRRSIFKPKLTLDRFDVRNLCDVALDNASATQPSDYFLDRIRYESLDSDESLLFDMSEDEREEYLGKKGQDSSLAAQRSKLYAYDYNKESTTKLSTPLEEIEFSFPVPEGMSVPRTLKQLLVIERTAKFILQSKDPLLEVKIQGRQGNLVEFGFLNRDNCLHEFFQKVKTLIKLGLYSYCKTEAVAENTAESKQSDPAKFVPAPPPEAPKPSDLSEPSVDMTPEQIQFITLFAKTAAFKGPTFEQRFRAERSSTAEFGFLLPWSKAHAFYLSQLDKARNCQEITKSEELGLVLPSKDFEVNQLISVLSQQVASLGDTIESLVHRASLRHKSLDFVFPWSSLYKYYSWKKQVYAKDSKLCDYSNDFEELTAAQVSARGVEFERDLQMKLCLDMRFAFLMPWDPQHTKYRNKVASTKPISPYKADGHKVMSRFAKTFAVHGPNLEHQIRRIFFVSPEFSFLLPWGLDYPQYLELLAQELLHNQFLPRHMNIPPVGIQPYINQLSLPSNASFWLALLLDPDNPLSSVRYGHSHFDYFAAKVDHNSFKGLPSDNVSSKNELQPLFHNETISDLPLEFVTLVPSMELCSWLQSRFAWFGAQLQHRPELPFLSDGHPLNTNYNYIVHQPPEDFSQSASDCFFPDHNDKLIVDALARLASLLGPEFQQFLLDFKPLEFTEAFPFLHPAHMHHVYYRWKVTYPNSEYPNYNCNSEDDIFLLDVDSLSPEQDILVNTTAAFVVRHGESLEFLLWPSSPPIDRFSFIHAANEYHSFYQRKKVVLSSSPLESYTDWPSLIQSSCSNEYIDKVVHLVSEMGAAFEQQIYLDHPEKLAFIHPSHQSYPYYAAQLNEIRRPAKGQNSPQPPAEPSSKLTELQKKRLARVKKLLYK